MPRTDTGAVRHCTLWVPDLETLRASPRVRRWLARGAWARVPQASAAHALFALFGVNADPLPWAAATHAFDSEAAGDCWLRADPVHLLLGTSHAVLAPQTALDLSAAEVAALGASLQPLFADRGLMLEQPCATRWYVRLSHDIPVQGPLPVVGTQAGLPGAQTLWNTLLTEAQMVLFAHPVNETRTSEGRVPVNSLWFWGGGCLARLPALWSQVRTEDPVASGLASCAGTPCSLSEVAAAGAGRVLWVPGGVAGPSAALEELERSWLEPLERALRTGSWDSVALCDHHGTVQLEARDLRAWWRRGRGPQL
ncbi:MAG TPA: hypothetical protein VFN52_05885 [Acidiferrobacteraceae bacterium]|nr:hypothetical protein [Acidiferrobacteraceae bacterium]